MKKLHFILPLVLMVISLAGCAAVDVTKTAAGFYEPTDPNKVEILKTKPDRKFLELGTLTVTGFESSETAKMHNAIRAKAAPLGANAVILTEEGMTPSGFGSYKRWATGVAIRFQ